MNNYPTNDLRYNVGEIKPPGEITQKLSDLSDVIESLKLKCQDLTTKLQPIVRQQLLNKSTEPALKCSEAKTPMGRILDSIYSSAKECSIILEDLDKLIEL